MDRISRTKQFLPFDALKGFKEALAEKEVEYDKRIDLTEDSYMELETQLNKLQKGSKVKIKYYKNKKYIEIEGEVTNIDYIRKKIRINDENINICDIVGIDV